MEGMKGSEVRPVAIITRFVDSLAGSFEAVFVLRLKPPEGRRSIFSMVMPIRRNWSRLKWET